jgi:effector-binding domain-containing protein
MIEAEVTGGVYKVDRAMEQLFKYRDDSHLSIMSIPFELLITDRRKEQDTSRWVTRVCAPIS